MSRRKRIWIWLTISFLIGLASCLAPRVYPYDPVLTVSMWLSGLWVLVFISCMLFERKRGLWLLTSAPTAVFLPVMLFFLDRACRVNFNACL